MFKKIKNFMLMGILGVLVIGCENDNKVTTKDGKLKIQM